MTLEQTTERILRAVEAQDLDALRAAAAQRRSALATLSSMPATPALREAVAASIAAGEAARRAIQDIRRKLRKDSGRLTRIERSFLRGLPILASPRIDYKG